MILFNFFVIEDTILMLPQKPQFSLKFQVLIYINIL